MKGRIATAGSSSEAPSVTLTALAAGVCSSVLFASWWNSAGTAQRNGTTPSSSMTSDPLQVPILDESSAPASVDCVPM